MKKLLFLLLISVFAWSCGKSTAFEAKVNGATVINEIKAGWKGATELVPPGEGKTAMHIFALRNYDYSPKGSENPWYQEPSAPEQVNVQFTIYGEKGKTDKTSTIGVGTYSSGSGNNNSLGVAGIMTFSDGKVDKQFVHFGGKPTDKGEVKITNVTDDTIEGEIDVVGKGFSKEISIKGKFIAKIQKAR